jgi:hypothetical protein
MCIPAVNQKYYNQIVLVKLGSTQENIYLFTQTSQSWNILRIIPE